MPFIQNTSLISIVNGNSYRKAGNNAMLIQIVDPDIDFPKPADQFKEIHQFKFLDAEYNDPSIDDSLKCSHEQAEQLVELLQHALDNDMNTVVHCHAGICRSGAVAEVGVMMGFTDLGKFRSPNLMVKHRMMLVLGLTYDIKEQPSTNGIVTKSGIIIPKSTF